MGFLSRLDPIRPNRWDSTLWNVGLLNGAAWLVGAHVKSALTQVRPSARSVLKWPSARSLLLAVHSPTGQIA